MVDAGVIAVRREIRVDATGATQRRHTSRSIIEERLHRRRRRDAVARRDDKVAVEVVRRRRRTSERLLLVQVVEMVEQIGSTTTTARADRGRCCRGLLWLRPGRLLQTMFQLAANVGGLFLG